MMTELTFTTEQLHWLTRDQAWHYRILPRDRRSDKFLLYCDDLADMDELMMELEILFGQEIELEVVGAEQISRALSKYYLRESGGNVPQTAAAPQADDFLTSLIAEAKGLKSSDIHIESYEAKCRVRIRIDGMLIEHYRLEKKDYPALVNQIKIIAGLDISERRLPQDGRISIVVRGEKFDIRVSVLPTLHGEKMVLRLLSKDATNIDLRHLGFSELDLANYMQGLKNPNGIMLISGPTGSGKTTTLYASLKELNKETRNILTVEDPVEYTLEGINQVQLKESIGLGFGEALRTFLRQDPDIIMVGEIRDLDTANMAIRAALTGHLVLSTIHTNSAWGTVSRLIEMGIPAFLVASTLNTTVAQRLVRLLCSHCKKTKVFTPDLFPLQFIPYHEVQQHFVSVGCEECYYTGYKGRKAVYEVIPIDQELAQEIKNGNMYVQDALKQRGIMTLAENAFNLFADGLTSVEEIYPLLLNY